MPAISISANTTLFLGCGEMKGEQQDIPGHNSTAPLALRKKKKKKTTATCGTRRMMMRKRKRLTLHRLNSLIFMTT